MTHDEIVDRLLNPTAADEANVEKVEAIRELVDNGRAALGLKAEDARQLFGLYILNAVYLGRGEPYEAAPRLVRRPTLTVVP